MDFETDRLLRSIGRGDTASLETLYHALKGKVYFYALSLLNDKDAAEDVLQDTFVHVFTLAGTHTPGRNGRAWIFAIAKNLCLDRLKSSDRSVRPLEENEEQHSDSPSGDFIRDLELKDALMRLEKKPRDIVLLHLAAGFKFREIAGLLGEKQSAVQWAYYSAVKALSSYYDDAISSKGADPDDAQ